MHRFGLASETRVPLWATDRICGLLPHLVWALCAESQQTARGSIGVNRLWKMPCIVDVRAFVGERIRQSLVSRSPVTHEFSSATRQLEVFAKGIRE